MSETPVPVAATEPVPVPTPAPGPATAPAAARLVVEGLRVNLKSSGADVVADVSFKVDAGEILGLVGESGSGKTTVAHALLGHARRGLEIVAGSVLLDGRDLLSMSEKQLTAVRGAEVSYVPQDPASALNPVIRVGAQLREALVVHPGTTPDIDQRIKEVLTEVKLDAGDDLLKRYPHQLSGGQQQRVALAMAFACRPKLIVLDEPTTGLDVTTQRHVLDTIRSLCEAYGVAAVYVSHDLAVVGELVQNVVVMYAGRQVEVGATGTIFSVPAHPYSARLLRAVPSPDRAEILEGIEGQPPRPGHRPKGCAFAPRCPLVIDKCLESAPTLVALGEPGHAARCFRATDGIITPRTAQLVSSAVTEPATVEGSLIVSNVTARYGRSEVVHSVSFDVHPGNTLALVGESGSGKTTLARCLVGMHSSWTGDIKFQGQTLQRGVHDRPAAMQRAIQYIFQNPYTSLNPRKTIGQLVSQPLEHFSRPSRAEMQERVVKVLDDVSLSGDFLRRYPDQLSGGERQRVAIARALVVEPALLVCDEVTSALDVSVQAVIIELLRQLQREHNLMMVFITHNLALVRAIGQTVVVLSEGRVVESGPADEILERPKHPYTVRLMEDVPKLEQVELGSAAG
jgi:peptide/nickel transport system ATP-binding protein